MEISISALVAKPECAENSKEIRSVFESLLHKVSQAGLVVKPLNNTTSYNIEDFFVKNNGARVLAFIAADDTQDILFTLPLEKTFSKMDGVIKYLKNMDTSASTFVKILFLAIANLGSHTIEYANPDEWKSATLAFSGLLGNQFIAIPIWLDQGASKLEAMSRIKSDDDFLV